MPFESEITATFIEYLKQNGYPENSITADYIVGERNRADVVIIDPKTRIPLEVYEIKNSKSSKNIQSGKEQVLKYLTLLNNKNIPAYLVFPNESEPFFEIVDINDISGTDIDRTINKAIDLNYLILKNSRINQEINEIQKQKKNTFDNFKLVCWILSLIIVCIEILIKTKLLSVDVSDLALIGVAIALVLMPFASKLKILGIEFERFSIDEKR
jgi:hypothetical protein